MENRQRHPPLSFRLGQAIDNVLSIISPGAANKRRAQRQAYWGYEAATMSRKDSFFPWDGRAESINKASRRTLRSRARDLERNSDVINAFLYAIENNVVGTGFNMQAFSDNEVFNKRIEALFKAWSTPTECDVTEQQSLDEIIIMTLRRMIIDGGILAVYSYDNTKTVPLRIQMREVDDLTSEDNPQLQSGNLISGGVEMNSVGKPVAYWLTYTDPNGLERITPQRIPAERCNFLWVKTRPSQYREVTSMSSSIVRTKDLDDYMGAVAFQQKTLACTSAFIETENTNNVPGRPTNTAKGERIETIEGGTVKYLRPGEKVSTLIPAGQAAEVENYIITNLRLISASNGLSLESATRNVERVNYSSARQNLISDQKTYNRIRKFLITHLLNPLYKKFVEACYFAGLLDNTGFNPDDPQYYEAKFLAGGLPWIDPLKEANADSIRLANGTVSFQEHCAAQGIDWRERILEMKEVNEFAAANGVKLAYNVSNIKEEEEEKDGENKKTGGSSGESGQ